MRPGSAQSFKAEEAAGYDAVAESFDRLSERFSGALADRLLALARPAPGERVLDVGTGTGLVALRAARLVGPTGKVVGIDLSAGMLRRARARAREMGLEDRASFEERDAEALGAEEASFDTVLSLFALPHFPEPAKAIKEMFRALRPGGKLVVAVGSGPPISIGSLGSLFRRLMARVEEKRARRLTAPAFLLRLMDEHLPRPSSQTEAPSHLDPRCVEPLLRQAGFVGLRRHWDGDEAILESADEFWEVQSTLASTARRRFAGAPSDRIASLRAEFFEKSRAVLASGGRLTYPYGASFFMAERPWGPSVA